MKITNYLYLILPTLFISPIDKIISQNIPAQFNYQVSIRNDQGNPIQDGMVSFRVSILENPNSNSPAYREDHLSIPTKLGICSFVIGNGTNKTNSLENVPFQSKSYFIKVELDETNGTTFKHLVTSQLLSVPYAFVASQLSQNNASIGQILKWDGSQWKPDSDLTSGTPNNLSGDVTGSPTANKVERIQNRPISFSTPSNGQVLKWDGSQWRPDSDLTSGTPSNLSGDVTGSPTNNKVDKIQNRPISTTTPLNGQVLKWDGSQWKPDSDLTSGISANLSGDVTGSPSNNIVEKIQNRSVSSNAPQNGQVLKWNGFQWSPDFESSSGGSQFWSSTGADIVNSNSGAVRIGNRGINHGEVWIHRANESNLDRILFFGFRTGANSSFGPLANLGIFNKASNLMGAGLRWTGSIYELFGTTKNFVIDHPKYPDSLIVYTCIEGPEAAAYERGTGKLINGRAEIKFSDHFSHIINSATITINLTPISLDSKGLAIINRNEKGFTVGELFGGNGDYEFDWEVKAVRKGFENNKVIRSKSEYKIDTEVSNK